MPRLSAGPRVLYKGTTGETYLRCASYVTVNRTLLAFAVDRRAAVDMDRKTAALLLTGNNRSMSLAGGKHDSKPAARLCCGSDGVDRRTDRRTDAVSLRGPCCIICEQRQESYTVIICQQSYLLLLSVFHHPLFHSRLKTSFFCKSFPPQPFLFFFGIHYMDSPHCLLLLLSIFRLLRFSCVFLHFLVVGSVR